MTFKFSDHPAHFFTFELNGETYEVESFDFTEKCRKAYKRLVNSPDGETPYYEWIVDQIKELSGKTITQTQAYQFDKALFADNVDFKKKASEPLTSVLNMESFQASLPTSTSSSSNSTATDTEPKKKSESETDKEGSPLKESSR